VTGTNVLVIKRYDRDGDRRIHQEDFAQVAGLPPARKYDHITYDQCAALVAEIAGSSAYFEFVRRLMFVVASGNSDAHLKNWSLLYPNGVDPELTPLYDQVSTIAWPDVTRELALRLGGVKPMLKIDEASIRRFAERAHCGVDETLRVANDTVKHIAEAWRSSRAADAMPKKHAAALRDYWIRAPLLREYAPAIF
jgi:serine/threonine-protein kinase HipA